MSSEYIKQSETPRVSLSGILSELDNILTTDPELLEASGIDERLIAEYVGDLTSQAQEKVDRGGQFLKLAEGRVKALKEESKRLALQAKYAENRIARFKAYWTAALQEHNMKEIRGNVYRVGLHRSMAVEITDPEKLPKEYQRIKTTVEPDKIAMKAVLKDGKKIPGAELVEKYSLAIK